MNCSYCYVRRQFKDGESSKDFEEAEILSNVDKILGELSGRINLELMGGEPLMNIDRVIRVCEYINENYKNLSIRFMVVTNGTYYSKRVIETIRRFNIQTTISIDGDKYSHDSNRRFVNDTGSWDVVYENSLNFLKDIPEYIAVSMTLNKLNINHLLDNILFLYNMGFKKINFTYNHSDINEDYIKAYTKQILNYYKDYNFKDLKLVSIKKNSYSTKTIKDETESIVVEIKEKNNSYEGMKFVNAWLSKSLEGYI